MSRIKIIALTAAGIGLIYLLNQAKHAGYLNFIVRNVDLKFQNAVPVLKLNLGIQNPSTSGFTVKAISGDLFANGEQIGNVAAFDTVVIEPATEVVYPLYIRLKMIGVVSDIVKLFSGGGISQQVEFDGAVNANGVTLPLKFTYVIG